MIGWNYDGIDWIGLEGEIIADNKKAQLDFSGWAKVLGTLDFPCRLQTDYFTN